MYLVIAKKEVASSVTSVLQTALFILSPVVLSLASSKRPSSSSADGFNLNTATRAIDCLLAKHSARAIKIKCVMLATRS